MAKKKFEFNTDNDAIKSQTIEADEFQLDVKNGTLTFIDENNEEIAAYYIQPGAWVKRVSK